MVTKTANNFNKKLLVRDQRAIFLITHKKSIRLILFFIFLVILFSSLRIYYNLPELEFLIFPILFPLIYYITLGLFSWIKWQKEIRRMIVSSIPIRESFIQLWDNKVNIEDHYSDDSVSESSYEWKEFEKVVRFKNTVFLFPKNKYKTILRISKEETNQIFFEKLLEEIGRKTTIYYEPLKLIY